LSIFSRKVIGCEKRTLNHSPGIAGRSPQAASDYL
jgi:hypothetical protein